MKIEQFYVFGFFMLMTQACLALEVGDKASHFALSASDGKTYTLRNTQRYSKKII